MENLTTQLNIFGPPRSKLTKQEGSIRINLLHTFRYDFGNLGNTFVLYMGVQLE